MTLAARPIVLGSSSYTPMFKNLFWGIQAWADSVSVTEMNADGYPAGATITDNALAQFPIPSTVTTATDMVLKWQGTQTNGVYLSLGAPGFTIISGAAFVSGGTDFNLLATGTNGRIVFRFNTVPSLLSFYYLPTGTFSGLNSLVLCKLSDEDSLDAATLPEQMFDDRYIQELRYLNPGVHRPMGWGDNNDGCNMSTFSHRPNWQTAFNLNARWLPVLWAGNTSGTNTYTCSSPSESTGSYIDGEQVQLNFVNANTSGTCTINVGARGAKTILNKDVKDALSNGTLSGRMTLTYSLLLDAFTAKAGGINSGIPLEIQVAASNRIGCDFWYNIPNRTKMTSVAPAINYIRDNLYKGLNLWVEYANEIWNGDGFHRQNTDYHDQIGIVLGFPLDNARRFFGSYGLHCRRIFAEVKTAWDSVTPVRPGLNRILACASVNDPVYVASHRYGGADLSTSLGYTGYNSLIGTNYNTSPNRPQDHAEAYSIANYYSGAILRNFDANFSSTDISQLTTAADNYASGNSTLMASALAWVDNDLRQGSRGGVDGYETLEGLVIRAGDWNAVAAAAGKILIYYEGGPEYWYPSTGTCTSIGISTTYGGPGGKIDLLIQGYKNSEMCRQLTIDQVSQLETAAPTARYSSMLLAVNSGTGQWNHYVTDQYSARYKSGDGIADINGSRRTWSLRS